MRIVRQHHEFDLTEAVPFIGKLVKLTLECVPETFPDDSSREHNHHQLGVLIGIHQDVTVEHAGSTTEHSSELLFEFEGGRFIGLAGASTITLDDLANRAAIPEEQPVGWPVRHG